MDEDIFPELCLMNSKKVYSKATEKSTQMAPKPNNVKGTPKHVEKGFEPGAPLMTKEAVELLLNGTLKTSVCRYCLKISPGMSELDQIMQIAGTGVMYKVTLRQMIASFYPFKAAQDENLPEKICQKCVDRALNAYLFTQQCEQAERALLNCFDDMYEKLGKLDPIDGPKKRGRQKLNPNYNILYAENKKVIDYAEPLRNIINTQTESLSNEPEWNEFECKKCWQVLPNIESLLNHEKTHPKYMWYHCRLCGKSFVKHNQLKRHFNRVHIQGKDTNPEVDKTFKCKECGNVTDNYLQHLQHIHKHKFKRVIKHVIEKKTDQLCLICLNKSNDLVDLDNMVCIHGGCPDIVGDKTLYTVLASTLPDQKAYKYRELYVPHKANIMTISKRKRKYQETLNIPSADIRYNLSVPKIVTKNKFRTNDFYYYVFCNPEINIISTIDLYVGTDIKGPRIVEITDEEQTNFKKDVLESMDVNKFSNTENKILTVGTEPDNFKKNCNRYTEMIIDKDREDIDAVKSDVKYHKTPVSHENYDIVQKDLIHYLDPPINKNKLPIALGFSDNKKNIILSDKVNFDIVENLKENLYNEGSEKITIADACDKNQFNSTNENLEDVTKTVEEIKPEFNFSEPIIIDKSGLTTVKGGLTIIKRSKSKASNMEYMFTIPAYNCNIQGKQITEEIKISDCDTGPNNKSKINWIFNKTFDIFTNINEINDKDCNYCWVFKHLGKCEYCKKSFQNAADSEKDSQNIQKDADINDIFKNNSEDDTSKDEIRTMIATKEKIDREWQCNICLTNNSKERSICHCCESKKYVESGNYKITFGDKKFFGTFQKETDVNENIHLRDMKTKTPMFIEEESMMDESGTQENEDQSMDMDTEVIDYQLDTKFSINEQMDVTEDVTMPNILPTFNPTPITTVATNIVPYVGTNLQFNIGSSVVGQGKGVRKIKRAIRNMPKAFHK